MPLVVDRRWIASDDREPALVELPGGEAAVVSLPAGGGDRVNEDCAAVLAPADDVAVLAVADGMGGGPRGQHASAAVIDALAAHLAEAGGAPEDVRAAVVNAIEAANAALCRDGGGAATTVALAVVFAASVQVMHVGDSTVLVVGQRGRLKLSTVAHSPVGFAHAAGLLDEGEAMRHPERHVVLNMVGMPAMRLDLHAAAPIADRDTLVLGTDGVFDNLSLDEVVDCVRAGPLAAGVERLVEATTARMRDPRPGEPSKPDDLTAIAYRRRAGA